MRSYTQNPAILEKLEAFRQMRERIRKPLTAEGLRLGLKALDRLAPDEAGKIAVIEQSVFRAWAGFFKIHADARDSPAPMKIFEQLEAERMAKMKERARLRDEAKARGEAV